MSTPGVSSPGGRWSGHAATESFVRVGPLMAIPAILRELDCEPEPLFRSVGLELARFAHPDFKIPYVAGSKLLARCVEATAREDFGLLVGERASPSSLGPAGYMLRVTPDVRTALRDLVDHLDLHDDGGVPFVKTAGPVTLFGYTICQPGVAAAGQIYDLAITVCCNIMRSLCGEAWRPSQVLLSRQPPRDRAPWERLFQAPLRFDAAQSAVAFPTRWLEHRLPGADPLLYRHLAEEAKALHEREDARRGGDLRRRLRRLVTTRKTTVRDIAKQLGMNERTLNRRLRGEGTTLHREIEEVRYAAAQQLLADSTMSLAKIAAALEYADPSAFSRAFKRWSGITPARWRAQTNSRAVETRAPIG